MTIRLYEMRCVYFAAILLVALETIVARGDAIVVSKAMQASTIAEIFIDQQGTRVELEIAQSDMEVFQDLLPDNVYAELGKGNMPLAERSQRFLREQLILRNQHHEPLIGSVVQTPPS